MEDFEVAKIEIIHGFKELYHGNATDFPDSVFFENIFYLANANKENYLFAKRIYHVLDDLFKPTKSFYGKYLNIDSINKTITIEKHIEYHYEVKHDIDIETKNYSNNLQDFAYYLNNWSEFLNHNTKSYSEYKYMKFLKKELNKGSYDSAYFNINKIEKLYKKDTLSIAIDKSINSMTFDKFIDIYSTEKISVNLPNSKNNVISTDLNIENVINPQFETVEKKITITEKNNRQPSPVTILLESNILAPKKKITNKLVKKRTTIEKYENKLYAICDLVEKDWRKETDKTVEQLKKIYKKAKGEYAESKQIDRSQLNTELKNTDGFKYIQNKLMFLYRENK